MPQLNEDHVVYLHEFDSVRSSKAEIDYAQRALFEEIVSNGSKVVLSFNQLTDSWAFVSMIRDENIYPYIMDLFKEGYIRVSLYGNVRTASQYIQNAINKCIANDDDGIMQNNTFYFSALPVKSTEINLLSCMADVLKYDDITLLQKKYETDENNLFHDTDRDSSRIVLMGRQERIKFLTRYLEMIMFISKERLAANPPKTANTANRFLEYIDNAQTLLSCSEKDSYRKAAAKISEVKASINDDIQAKISELDSKILAVESDKSRGGVTPETIKLLSSRIKSLEAGKNAVRGWRLNRSVWYKHFRDMYNVNQNPDDYEILSIAEAVIDVCYNLQVENSISSVLKHYREDDSEDFNQEFMCRLTRYLNHDHEKKYPEHKFLVSENVWEEITVKHKWDISDYLSRWLKLQNLGLTRWGTAARINESARKGTKGILERFLKCIYQRGMKIPRYIPAQNETYEEVTARDRKAWKEERKMRIYMTLLLLAIEGAIVWFIEEGFETLQEYSSSGRGLWGWLMFVIIFGGMNWFLSWAVGIPELSDIFKNAAKSIWDAVFVVPFAPKNIAYARKGDI